jgi:hypothetical protein
MYHQLASVCNTVLVTIPVLDHLPPTWPAALQVLHSQPMGSLLSCIIAAVGFRAPSYQLPDWRLCVCCLPAAAARLLLFLQNGCNGVGDAVEDTPFCAGPTEGCPANKDTCPQPGTDPTRNFMDYSDDSCMRSFSAGQHQRVEQMWKQYRMV